MTRRGVIVGKFYPPHRGHHYLIDEGLSRCDELYVLVGDNPTYDIPAATRVAWLRQRHPEAHVVIISELEGALNDDARAWGAHTQAWLGWSPDVVFSSEEYGARYAQAMGANHIMIDADRVRYPVSGTAVRDNVSQYVGMLEPETRAHYVRRICVLGAESTGTTTVCQDLAERLSTLWVPEYGRELTVLKMDAGDMEWRVEDFTTVAATQIEREDKLAQDVEWHGERPFLVCDTDALATTVWCERYGHLVTVELRKLVDVTRYEQYFLTDCDIPFEQDGVRDGEHIREWMTDRFRDVLDTSGARWHTLRGTRAERVDTALDILEVQTKVAP